jgi:hypothetical protein
MAREKPTWIRIAFSLGGVIFTAGLLAAGELPGRAPLAEVHAIGQVVATMSSGSTADETAVRQMIERRLVAAGITVDPSLDTQLVAAVDVSRDTSLTGQKHVTYAVSLSFQEPVRTERAPHTAFLGTTWAASVKITRFGADVPLDTILDSLDRKIGSFLTTVNKDTAAAKAGAEGGSSR